MQARTTTFRATLKAFLALLWLVCLYRAITQSVVHDEAFTYQLYIAAPFRQIFHNFDANHHFLNTLLMRLSVAVLGVSEWSMRLPALAGAALYFTAVYRIGTGVFRTVAASVVAVALLALNPFVLDFMVAARGYGMALALFLSALVILVRDSPPRRLTLAGVLLALAVAANLIFAVPVFVLAALVLLRRAHGIKVVFARFLAPMAAVGLLFFLAAPLRQANSGNFYFGAANLAESLRSLAAVSLAYGGPWRSLLLVNIVAFAAVPALLLGALTVGIRRRDALLLLAAGTAAGSAAILLFAHVLARVPYPIERTGFYFLALVPLCLAGLVDCLPGRAPRLLLSALGLAVAAQFALEFNVKSFLTWQYDADTRALADRLAQMAPRRQPASVRVDASWQLEPSLNFYRDKKRLKWMRPVERAPLTPGADFYAIMISDRPMIEKLGLRPVYQWPVSGTILAVPLAAH